MAEEWCLLNKVGVLRESFSVADRSKKVWILILFRCGFFFVFLGKKRSIAPTPLFQINFGFCSLRTFQCDRVRLWSYCFR